MFRRKSPAEKLDLAVAKMLDDNTRHLFMFGDKDYVPFVLNYQVSHLTTANALGLDELTVNLDVVLRAKR